MSLTVDLVVTGNTNGVLEAALGAVRRGQRVLVVLSTDTRTAQRVRRDVRRAADVRGRQLMVLSNAEVACVEAIDRVEAVVIRYPRTGRLSAVNASAFVSCDEGKEFSREFGTYNSGRRALRSSRRSP